MTRKPSTRPAGAPPAAPRRRKPAPTPEEIAAAQAEAERALDLEVEASLARARDAWGSAAVLGSVDPRTVPVRHSRLKAVAQSLAHYWAICQGPTDETIATRIGTGFHAALFGDREVAIYDRVRHGKHWERFESRAKERNLVVLSPAEGARQAAMVRAVRSNELAMRVLFDGAVIEREIAWSHLGRACTSRPDALARSHVSELKSTRCADPGRFRRDALKLCYHTQLSFYDEAEPAQVSRELYIVACESLPPHSVTVFRLTDEARRLADTTWRVWFEAVQIAEATGEYPGYSSAIVDLGIDDLDMGGPIDMEAEAAFVPIEG